MNKLFVLLLASLMLSTFNADAQINVGKIKNKIKDKVNGENSETNSNQGSGVNNNQNQVNSNSQNKSKKTEVDPFAPVKDNGMTDDIHAKHVKEVVFSKTPIESANKSFDIQSNVKEELLTKSFNLADDIYFLAYFGNSFYNEMMKDKKAVPDNTRQTPRIWFEVNGKEAGKKGDNKFSKNMGPYDFKEWTWLSYPKNSLTKFDSFSEENPQLAFYSYVLPLLQAGDNKVKVIVSFDVIKYNGNGGPEATMTEEERTIYSPAQPMASGEMTIKVNNISDVKAMLIKSGYIPQAAQSNPALEKQIMNIYNSGKSENKAVKAIIYSSDWSVRRDDYGNILGRYVGVKVVVTTTDPNYYVIWDKSAEQPYTGGGQYSTKIVLSNYTTPCYTVSSALFK